MDWSNERYVRLYTRDTATWRRLGWEGQCLLCLMLRKVDRAGVVDGIIDAVDDLILMTGLPPDIVDIGYQKLVKHEVIMVGNDTICLPNFLEAQETPKSDVQRQRDSRESRRSKACAIATGVLSESRNVKGKSQNVNGRSQRVNIGSQPVTPGHTGSRGVTPSLTDPNLTDPGGGGMSKNKRQKTKDKEERQTVLEAVRPDRKNTPPPPRDAKAAAEEILELLAGCDGIKSSRGALAVRMVADFPILGVGVWKRLLSIGNGFSLGDWGEVLSRAQYDLSDDATEQDVREVLRRKVSWVQTKKERQSSRAETVIPIGNRRPRRRDPDEFIPQDESVIGNGW